MSQMKRREFVALLTSVPFAGLCGAPPEHELTAEGLKGNLAGPCPYRMSNPCQEIQLVTEESMLQQMKQERSRDRMLAEMWEEEAQRILFSDARRYL